MSNLTLPATVQSAKISTFTRDDAGSTVHVQAIAQVNPFTATIGSLAAVNAVVMANVADASSAAISFAGTYAGTFSFEASDDSGVTWYAIDVARSTGNVAETSTGSIANISRLWELCCSGYTNIRVKCTAYISGSATIRISPSHVHVDPVPVIQSHIVTMNTAGSQGNAWNAAAVVLGGVSAAIDTGAKPYISIFGNASAATKITVQFSADNVNYYDSEVNYDLIGAGNFGSSSVIGARYIKLKSSVAATITATVFAKG